MRRLERIPLHDHSDDNSGGKVDRSSVTTYVSGALSSGTGSGGALAVHAVEGPYHDTTETDTDKRLAPDGVGGVEWAATSGTLPWFNVKDPAYGAVGDGTTDDRAAINLAIADLNAAGAGVLYFPASPNAYLVSAGLTAISVQCKVLGDGWATTASGPVSRINFTSTTGILLTLSDNGSSARDLALVQTGGTATAGAAISCSGGTLASFDGLVFKDFWIGLDLEGAAVYHINRIYCEGMRKYGIRVRNTSNPDAGDGHISNVQLSNAVAADAALRIEAGGAKITNCKINGSTSGSSRYTTGIDVAIQTGAATSVLVIDGNSIENVAGDGIKVSTTGTGRYGLCAILGNQVSLYGNNSGYAVNITAASTGGIGTNGGIGGVVIDSGVFRTDGTARAAVSLTNADTVVLGDYALLGFNARYTSSGATNVTDSSTPSFATPAILLGSTAASGAASTVIRSDATIAAFSASAPTVGYGTAATGSAGTALRSDATITPPTEAQVTFTDITTNDVGTSKHGYAPKAPNDATKYLDGTGAYSVPAGGSGTTFIIIGQEQRTSDGSTTAWTLDNDFEENSVSARNLTTGHNLSVTETLPNTATISAAGTAGDVIAFSYAASVA